MMMSNKKIEALKDLAQMKEDTVKSIDIANAKKVLDEEIIGMDGVKKQVLEFLDYRNKCIEQGIKPDKPLVVSLDGPAGTAKTTIGRAIAKAAGLPHKEINMAGATGKSKIIGNESVYTGSSWGEFADAQLEYKTKNIVYTLDELEKTGTSDHNGKIEDTILPLLDGRHKIKDDFLGVDVDISDSIVLITTNDFKKLSEPLRDRISYKFKIQPYTLDEKAKVAKFKFDRSMKYHKMDDKVEVDQEIFNLIANSVSDQGGREATDIAENIAHKIFIMPKNSGEKIKITTDMVNNWLKESKNAA
jgi:ATP-dependent Lon protease